MSPESVRLLQNLIKLGFLICIGRIAYRRFNDETPRASPPLTVWRVLGYLYVVVVGFVVYVSWSAAVELTGVWGLTLAGLMLPVFVYQFLNRRHAPNP